MAWLKSMPIAGRGQQPTNTDHADAHSVAKEEAAREKILVLVNSMVGMQRE